jgi:hypothetical protein
VAEYDARGSELVQDTADTCGVGIQIAEWGVVVSAAGQVDYDRGDPAKA